MKPQAQSPLVLQYHPADKRDRNSPWARKARSRRRSIIWAAMIFAAAAFMFGYGSRIIGTKTFGYSRVIHGNL